MQPAPPECPDCGGTHDNPGITATLCDHPCHDTGHELMQMVGAPTGRHQMQVNPDLPAPTLTQVLWLLAAFAAFMLLLLTVASTH